MQSTAMNEPIFLAFFLWAVVYLDEFCARPLRLILTLAATAHKCNRGVHWKPAGSRWPGAR